MAAPLPIDSTVQISVRKDLQKWFELPKIYSANEEWLEKYSPIVHPYPNVVAGAVKLDRGTPPGRWCYPVSPKYGNSENQEFKITKLFYKKTLDLQVERDNQGRGVVSFFKFD